MKSNILLVYAPMDEGYYIDGVNDSPPLGLLVLQNYLQNYRGLKVDVTIIDGEYHSLGDILSMLDHGNYDLVGVQSMLPSYLNSIAILTKAKALGIVTVMGGHHATQLAELIVTKRSCVDFVVAGDGEEALAGLVLEHPFETIPNLVYLDRTSKKVVRTVERNVSLDLGRIDRINDSNLLQYLNGDVSKLERGEQLVSFRAYSHKGCSNRTNSQYCFFCGRADKGIRFKSPKVYLEELKYLSERGFRYVFEIGDDFLQDSEWLSEVCRFKRQILPEPNFEFKIFARANRVVPEVIPLLRELNVCEVAIGFESGSSRILKMMHKNDTTAEDNVRAAKLLFENKIDTIASFVLGLPGEDDESLHDTYTAAVTIRDLAERYLGRAPQEIIANLIEVHPGSPAYNCLKEYAPHKYLTSDHVPLREAQNDYFKAMFNMQDDESVLDFRRRLNVWGKKVNELGNYTYPCGWEKGDLA